MGIIFLLCFKLALGTKFAKSAILQLDNLHKKSNKKSMKSLLVALGVLCLTVISCTKSDESLQPNQSEIESRRRPGGGGGTGETSGVAQVTGLSATAAGSTQINLAWNGVTGGSAYWIYRNNSVLAIVTNTYFSDGTVSPGTSYTYSVAVVVNGVLGPKSSSVTVTP